MAEESARANLRLTLSRLRKVLGDCLITVGPNVAFDFSRPHFIDLAAFEQAAISPEQRDPQQLGAALALYQAEFLQGFTLRDAPEFETWITTERERLHQRAITACTHLAESTQQQGQWTESITWTRRLLTLEPWHEEAHRRLMWLLAHSGQRTATCRRIAGVVWAFGWWQGDKGRG